MPRFFFHVCGHHQLYEDSEGQDLADIRAVLFEVLRVQQELLGEQADLGELKLQIADSDGRTLLIVPVHTKQLRREENRSLHS